MYSFVKIYEKYTTERCLEKVSQYLTFQILFVFYCGCNNFAFFKNLIQPNIEFTKNNWNLAIYH